jgi:hypothetical protein
VWLLGLQERVGALAPGAAADIVVLSREAEVIGTIVAGVLGSRRNHSSTTASNELFDPLIRDVGFNDLSDFNDALLCLKREDIRTYPRWSTAAWYTAKS